MFRKHTALHIIHVTDQHSRNFTVIFIYTSHEIEKMSTIHIKEFIFLTRREEVLEC